MTYEGAPSQGYVKPSVAWCVEYVDPSEPESGSHQVGAFTIEAEAPMDCTRAAARRAGHDLGPQDEDDLRLSAEPNAVD